MAIMALACTGDPLLDLLLAECCSFSLRQTSCETLAEALQEVEEQKPTLFFISPALCENRPVLNLKGVRVCYLLEGAAPDELDADVLAAERITPELVDAWVRCPARPAQGSTTSARPQTLPPSPRSAQIPPPPPLRPTGEPASPQGAPLTPPAQPRTQPMPASRPLAARANASRSRSEPIRPVLSVLRQQVVTFWGGKPGAGRSTLAVALSDLLSRAGGIRVCTVDLNPWNSSLAALVGKEQEVPSWFHLSEALARGGSFPPDSLRWVKPNWAILSGPDGRPDWVQHLTSQAIIWLVDGLRTQFDYIILDPEARPGEVRETAARLAQTLLLTLAPDYPDVLDTTRSFEAGLEQGIIDRGRCRLVLNRWLETPHLPSTDVADCFGIPVSLTIPAAPDLVVGATSQGVPVTQLDSQAGRSLVQALGGLAGLVAEPLIGAAPERGGLLKGLFGR